MLESQTERDILIHVEVRKKRVLLEYRVDRTLVRRQVVDLLAVEKNVAGIRSYEAADNSQCRRLAAAGRSQQRHELLIMNVEVYTSQYGLTLVFLGYALKLDYLVFVH